MEECSEAHMETDVSSTTEDVPETQEVTGSHGNVETVIVVEKVEEDMNSNTEPDKETSQVDDKTDVVSATIENSPQKVSKTQVLLLKSPIKAGELQKSPSKPEPSLKVVDKESQPNEVQLPIEMQETEVVDSSSKEPQPIEVTEENNTSKEPQKSVEKSPLKEVQAQESPTTKPCLKSPLKDVVSQGPSKKIISTVKEFTLPENSVINGKIQSNDTIVKVDDSTIKQGSTHINVIPIDITIERDASNDSQVESNIDTTEKDHNKSISRELKSLINSAKESKIISECTQLTSKTRKSRTLDTSNASLNTSIDPDKIHGNRRSSNNSQKSNCSEKSDKAALKRSMRSQNPEFVNKVKQFLNSVTGKGHKDSDDDDEVTEENSKEKIEQNESVLTAPTAKIKKTEDAAAEKHHKLRSDPYCWRCHWAVEQVSNDKAHPPMLCTVCPRSFHYKCLSGNERSKINIEKNWVCPECMIVLHAESSETRSPAMKKISLGMLCELLKHALDRMMELNGVEPFMQPVDRSAFPDYDKYVVHPMDLSLMRDNIAEGLYGSTEAFLADAQWILHNSIIFNTLQSKLTGGARALVRWCRAQMGEVEACPQCYAAAHQRRPTWFTDVCAAPHALLWAKLKGFPYWPAKGMSVSAAGLVDVRFFGAHDRAWVPAKDCFLYSERDPNNFRTKRQDILDSMQEAEQHIRNISRKYGKFVYPPFKTQFDPSKLNEQLKLMIPSYEGEVRSPVKDKAAAASPAAKDKSRSNSKSSKGSGNDGDVSESDDTQAVSSRKMADGAEIARVDEDSTSPDKTNTSMDVDSPQSKGNNSSRKRRRSELEEAVITIIETSTGSAEKKKRVEDKTDDKKPENAELSSSKEMEGIAQAADNTKDVVMTDKTKGKAGEIIPKGKDNEPSSSTTEKEKKEEKRTTLRVTPIRIAIVHKDKKNTPKTKDTTAKIISPKENGKTIILNKDNSQVITPNKDVKITNKDEKITPQRQKPVKVDKTPNSTPKDDRSKSEKRRNSRNKSLNNSTAKDRNGEKNAERNVENNIKDKPKENSVNGDLEKQKANEKRDSPKPNNVDSPKAVKDRLRFDDDTTLAVIARKSGKSITNNNVTGLPTISSVRSLSAPSSNAPATITKTTNNAKTIEVTVEANSECSIFTPTSTDNVKTMKDAVSKLQKLRNGTEPTVGRVGVRAFARMTSPDRQTKNDDVQVEIKSEPIELDDPERHTEKMDLMNAFKLRPVNPASLREVRIEKAAVLPPPPPAKKAAKPAEVRPRAKKTFPQPRKPDDGRSELNGKNSMVYIPIQPPAQAPPRAPRPAPPPAPPAAPLAAPPARLLAPVITSVANNHTNTMTSPVMQLSSVSASPGVSTGPGGPTVGQVATTVHTVPLMTSVNGQWMFSFQPVMSVGAIDGAASPPALHGLAERGAAGLRPLGSPAPAPAPTPTPTPTLHTTAAPTQNSTRPSTDTNTPGEPPRLQQRPALLLLNPLDPAAPAAATPAPSTAGPLTAKLNQNAVKLADYFRTLLEDTLEKVEEPAMQLTVQRLQNEQAGWRHKQQLDEIKHNHELTLAEMRASFEKEKVRAVSEARRAAQLELEAAVKQAKSKQWCANCSQEAQFYCCWNTSYCDYPCQRAHWAQHFSVCTQQRSQDGSNGNGEVPSSPEHRLQPQPDLPKNAPAPTLTVGGKLAPSRVYTQDQSNSQKTSIIVSMVEDPNGNQTMKCVGTYKPPTPAQPPPIILNKQLLSSEESVNKKVMSSGGYLIVGGGRRAHSAQYFT